MVAIGRTRSRLKPCVVLFPVKSGGLPTAGFNREAPVWFATSTTRLDTHLPTLSCAPWMAKAAHKWGWLQFADAVSGSQAVGGVCLAAEAGRLSADILSRCLAPAAIGPVFSRTHRTFAARTASPRQLALMGSKANSGGSVAQELHRTARLRTCGESIT
jgi:hypothetical protein